MIQLSASKGRSLHREEFTRPLGVVTMKDRARKRDAPKEVTL